MLPVIALIFFDSIGSSYLYLLFYDLFYLPNLSVLAQLRLAAHIAGP